MINTLTKNREAGRQEGKDMTDYNKIFGFKAFSGNITKRQLRRDTEWTEVYKDYTISFGKAFHEDGHIWWEVGVWKNEGNRCSGAFTMASPCATDSQAMRMERAWAKENIDRLKA